MTFSLYRTLALLGLVSALAPALPVTQVRAQTSEEMFVQAAAAYREGRFQEATDLYEGLIRAGKRTGQVFYNLGNTYFRLGRLGPAVLNYERARWFMPRDPDLEFNLRLSRERCRDALQEQPDLLGSTFFWMDAFNLKELFWSFVILNASFWGILAVRLFVRSEGIYYLVLVFFAAWLLTGLTLGLKVYGGVRDGRAIVIADEASVLAGPDRKETVLFKLHAGAGVQLERSEAGWCLIRLPDQRRGWVKRDAVERIMEGLAWPGPDRSEADGGEAGR